MDDMEKLLRMGLSLVPHMTEHRLKGIFTRFSSAREAFSERDALEAMLPKTAKLLSCEETAEAAAKAVADAARLEITALSCLSKSFPNRLRSLDSCPAVIYVRGDIQALSAPRAIAAVGSRKCSEYGRSCARSITRQLAQYSVSVVSGLAMGIDAMAHTGALEGGGVTVAVLAGGAETCYPLSNARLYSRILEQGGAIVSENPPSTPSRSWLFPLRNRLIAGLSDATLLCEADIKSGSWHTVSSAISQGKDVFCVPGQIAVQGSRLPHKLIREGARLVSGADDIMEDMSWDRPAGYGGERKDAPANSLEASVLDLLSVERLSFDELIDKTGASIPTLSVKLTEMELRGDIVKKAGRIYSLL
ncbi:MAG: DNA-processing protein DprA [Eubacteriales bacterium]|nr:DNA-processing protein DprA [Eubacteriales bacterium]MDD3880746.1 DNA-processing protein DprA [Eubacteriales bacterium]MDD3882907.1 DNA-processing protein DprA [Eubacteriales bacterium]MDD4511621.1 DNA-processing protein DprA [Eubacteriales bacterium]